jgi:hypothetical protein
MISFDSLDGLCSTSSMKTAVATTVWVLGLSLLCSACGRTPLLPPTCYLQVDPVAIDFGAVLPGNVLTRQVRVGNDGGAVCGLTGIAIRGDSSGWFSLSAETPAAIAVPVGSSVELDVSFAPDAATSPFKRSSQVVFASNAPGQTQVVVSLTGQVKSTCSLDVSPTAIDFGSVPIGTSRTSPVILTNQGTGPCSVEDIGIAPGSDSQFYLSSPLPAPSALSLAPGQSGTVVVGFAARDRTSPHHRGGQLALTSNDSDQPDITVALAADIDVGCELTWTPARVDFGNVMLNTVTSADVTLSNGGTSACGISGLDLSADSDPDFALADTQSRSFSLAPATKVTISVLFTAADSSPPHSKAGTLAFQTGDTQNPQGQIPLSAYVSTVCIEASRWVYTVDTAGRFSRFDPSTLTFTDIGTLHCPGEINTPNSMAVDQNAVAWVSYTDGNLFKVDTSTAKCEATGFVSDQHNLLEFGMGFVFDPSTGEDTLYVAGTSSTAQTTQSTLATIAVPSLVVTPIGLVTAGNAELTGTGDGQLWGFVPNTASSNRESTLVRIDPATGKTLESYTYPSLVSSGGDVTWAVKFWGGSFWIFFNDSIYQVSRDSPDTIHAALSNTGRYIVGAGVSTCAPLL